VNGLIGRQFNRLTVLSYSHKDKANKFWLCRCECGNEKPIRHDRLGKVQSCGCHRQEQLRERALWRNGHIKEFQAYQNMLQAARIHGYQVYECWRCSFENFFADTGEAPSPAHVFVRVDKREGFEPANCIWATREEARKYRATIEWGTAAKLDRLTLDTVIRRAPAFFLALPKEDRREVLRLAFRLPAKPVGPHTKIQHLPSWRCEHCRDELVGAIAWERLSRMKGEDLSRLTISQALLDLSIERLHAERDENAEMGEATLKERAYEDYLFLSTGRASRKQFEQLWASELRGQYMRLHAAKLALREQDGSEQDKD
jgi:hypothetical protein